MAAGPPQSLEEAEQFTGKPELDARDTARDGGEGGNERASFTCVWSFSIASALAA